MLQKGTLGCTLIPPSAVPVVASQSTSLKPVSHRDKLSTAAQKAFQAPSPLLPAHAAQHEAAPREPRHCRPSLRPVPISAGPARPSAAQRTAPRGGPAPRPVPGPARPTPPPRERPHARSAVRTRPRPAPVCQRSAARRGPARPGPAERGGASTPPSARPARPPPARSFGRRRGRTLRLAEGPLEEPGGAPISYSPVTSVSRWISSRRHFRALPGSWKEMGRAGPARSSSASSGASLRRGRPGGGRGMAAAPGATSRPPPHVTAPPPASRRRRAARGGAGARRPLAFESAPRASAEALWGLG